MLRSWWRTPAGLAAAGNVAKVFTTPLGAGVVAALLGRSTLAMVLIALGAASGAIAVLLALAEARARRIEVDNERAARLRVFPIRAVKGVMPYEVGVDPEAPQARGEIGGGNDPKYLERDRDSELRDALKAARASEQARMVVLSGQSKAGKSRTLFEVAQQVLGDHQLIAPNRGPRNLSQVLAPGGLPGIAPGRAVLWLDDLEDFVAADEGMQPSVLDHDLAGCGRPVIVLATEGGKGLARRSNQESRELEDPIRRLLRHELVTKVELDVGLSLNELARARQAYPPMVAKQLEQAGIGEYMIAADELIERLNRPRDADGKQCPEGAAVVWAAIDWQRAGITAPVPRDLLQQLYVHYLTGLDPTPACFARGLEWARKPLYSSIALLRGDDAFSPFSYIVTHVAGRPGQPINADAWDRIIETADLEQALAVGLAAYRQDDLPRAERAWRQASSSASDAVASRALVNLGILLEELKQTGDAETAFRGAATRGDLDGSRLLGRRLYFSGDLEGAEDAFRRGDERGDDAAANGLGVVLQDRGDLEGAEDAFRRGDERGNGNAANGLGIVLKQRGDLEGAEDAFRRGDERGNGHAANSLGIVLEERGDLEGAEDAYRRGDKRGNSHAANNLGVVLHGRGDLEGAERAFARAVQLEGRSPPPIPGPVVPRGLRSEQ